MAYIRNTQALLDHGDAGLRRAALDIVGHALAAVDAYPATRRVLRYEGGRLHVGDEIVDLDGRRLYFIGAGKASFGIARAVEEIAGAALADGIVVCKHGQEGSLARIRLRHAAHPVPDEAGLAAAHETMAMAAAVGADDIVLCGITGGSSALLPLPAEGLSLDHKKRTTEILLTCGADIFEINAVRKHLSRIKGGRLAQAIHPAARIFNLTISDVVGNALDYITDLTVPDSSTLGDARSIFDKYALWERVPPAVRDFLRPGGPAAETPKTLAPRRIASLILADGETLCAAAAVRAKELGFAPLVLSTSFAGESRELGRAFAAMAREVRATGRPLAAPCALIGGGETVVTIAEWGGAGGPNQEFALGAATDLRGLGGVLVLGLDSDGTDGPTPLAGGLVDATTLPRALEAGLDLHEHLRRHETAAVFGALGDGLETGATGTNVNDLKLVLILPKT